MRNVFDQYDQAENKLTHALISTLYHERKLIRPFLRWLKVKHIPHLVNIEIGIQQLPGEESQIIQVKEDSVPDAYFCDNKNWAVMIESKVQAGISINQLRRHRKKALRYGYDDIYLILISVNPPKRKLPSGVFHVQWKSIYQWFVTKSLRYEWARYFIEYMQIYESKMLAQDYNIRGTLTMFAGFRFDKENPYTYREGKRLIRLLGQEFRKNERLKKTFGIDPKSKGRPAITRGEGGAVWDLIQTKKCKSKAFTSHPHLTMVIRPTEVSTAITIPNGIKGGIKGRFKNIDVDEFHDLLAQIERNLQKLVKRSPGTKPNIYVTQRSYKSQRSYPITHGRIEVDLRTLVKKDNTGIKHQPMWTEAIYNLLTHKKTNIQFGIEVRFPISDKCMRSSKAVDVMVDAWIAMKPLLDFML